MKEPIIVNDSGDVLVFTTVAKAESYLEPIDILKGENEVYDSDGVRLTASILKNDRGRERVTLRFTEPRVQDAERLRVILTRFLSKVSDAPQPFASLSLEQLVETSLRFKIE
jgi:hypothetical protein